MNVTFDIPREEVSARFMDAGIHENVELTKVETGISPNGNKFLAFYFRNELGETGSHTEWETTNEDPAKKLEKELNQISRVKQIATCFMPAEQFVFQAKDFQDFAYKTVNLLSSKITGVKLRVKFVYPKETSKFTSLPSYWRFRFIERMDNNGFYGDKAVEKSNVKILSMDRVSRPKADTPPVVINPFNNQSGQIIAENPASPF